MYITYNIKKQLFIDLFELAYKTTFAKEIKIKDFNQNYLNIKSKSDLN